ncbi:MAG TPA: HAD family phosphatase [Clostridia bacterium]|nr:HAD family phosphatase [Clostridia bacterium]
MNKKGIIFDFNGTLLWDTHLHNIAWDNFLKRYDFFLSDEEKHQLFHGRLNKEILAELFKDRLTEAEIERYGLEKEYEYQRLCIELKDFSLSEGVVELFEKLSERNIPFVIATASGLENVEFYIKRLELDRWFKKEHIIYNDGSMRGKPFPDLFLKAIDVLGIDSKNIIIFEDSVSGIKAAEAAAAGNIIIVNSNNCDYKEWEGKHPIIRHFNEVDWAWFEG